MCKNFSLEGFLFFSKEISYYGKEGYVEVSKEEDKYFLEIFYNYAKISMLSPFIMYL